MISKKVYISGALMAAKNLDSVKELYQYIATICVENGFQPYLPHDNTDPIKDSQIPDYEVYRKDFNEIIRSFLVISYIGEPSLGVGAELSICIAEKIPVITIAESGSKVSRFIKGMLQSTGSAVSIEFHNRLDLTVKLSTQLRLINKH